MAQLSSTAAYVYFPNKEALFIAAVDEDTSGVVNKGIGLILAADQSQQWREDLLQTLLDALDDHPLARRVLGGLEPEFTVRQLDIPVLAELRKVYADRLVAQQPRATSAPTSTLTAWPAACFTIVLSMLMSLIQTGLDPTKPRVADVHAVFEAALAPLPVITGRSPTRRG